jgi:plastocyanin
MKKTALGIPVLLVMIGLALFGCDNRPVPPTPTVVPIPATTVQMAPTSFVQTTRTIKAGQALLFSDTVDGGGLHIICLGHDQQCNTNAQGPSALMSPGFTITPGTTKAVVFPTAGTYQITCTVHPNMNLTVTVQ